MEDLSPGYNSDVETPSVPDEDESPTDVKHDVRTVNDNDDIVLTNG